MNLLEHPITDLFLYFILYSFLGWVMETCYCSIVERKVALRGFLYGPICPIYGIGALLMILFFTPFKHNLALFYTVSVIVMSGWEYFVGWLMEVTTHVKYWDYSQFRFHLKGRICLWVALVWGLLSYLIIFWVHPPIQALVQPAPLHIKYIIASILLVLFMVDAVLTIRNLALVSNLVVAISALSGNLQCQLSLGRAELNDKLEESATSLRRRYSAEIAKLEKYSRHFRRRFADFSINRLYQVPIEDIRAAAEASRKGLKKQRSKSKPPKS